ncbi:hypothetical protein NMY22_g18218 [Coprinellus aureogranulatus]|nr:hypothetical protein NMY22_g18218 [Coprinellus aureogranulatus]
MNNRPYSHPSPLFLSSSPPQLPLHLSRTLQNRSSTGSNGPPRAPITLQIMCTQQPARDAFLPRTPCGTTIVNSKLRLNVYSISVSSPLSFFPYLQAPMFDQRQCIVERRTVSMFNHLFRQPISLLEMEPVTEYAKRRAHP